MPERLRPSRHDVLVDGVGAHADARRHARHLRAPDDGFDYERLVGADQRPDRVRAAVPAADPADARPGRQPGLGRRRGLRPRLPRAPLGAAAARLDGAAARPDRPDHEPPARPQPAALGDLPGRGARGRPVRHLVQVAPGARRRHHRRPRPAHPRRHARSHPRRPTSPGTRSARAAASSCSPRRSADSVRNPAVAADNLRGQLVGVRQLTDRVTVGGRRRSPGGRPAPRRPAGAPSCRSSAASSRSRRGCRPTARSARSTAAASTTSSSPPSPARCAAGC